MRTMCECRIYSACKTPLAAEWRGYPVAGQNLVSRLVHMHVPSLCSCAYSITIKLYYFYFKILGKIHIYRWTLRNKIVFSLSPSLPLFLSSPPPAPLLPPPAPSSPLPPPHLPPPPQVFLYAHFKIFCLASFACCYISISWKCMFSHCR